MEPLRVGIIGAGIMGADHVKTLHRFVSGVEPVLLADLDQGRARDVAAMVPGLRVTGDAVALIDDADVDAVVIASHDSTHAELVLACLRAGKPVLCEKPLAPTVAECAAIVRAQAGLGLAAELISLGFMRRFDPGYVELAAALRTAEAGKPLIVHATCRGVSSGPGTTSESAVTNSAVHDLDVVPWLIGAPVVQVCWQAAARSSTAPDFVDPQVLLLRLESGVLCIVELYLNARYGYDIRCEVVCETGTLALTEPVRLVRDGGLARSVDYSADWRPRFADAYRLELQAWADSVRTGATSAMATARDGWQAARIAEAIHRSMHDGGHWVAVSPE